MKRCAIYTRKSSEEGLEQHFNSLDAQREACEAYIMSQAGEGWTALPARYDDGGYSGGSMERPALQRLLADVGRGLVDIVVVYKIDRLTRSLADFARIVEKFDERAVSFVSVTQAFNTTSSMGRLTLNVLLSFAQFEREVTGERIRDKIAASKAKGLWMGGLPPLGYDVPADGSRVLQINETEARIVRHIFHRYLGLGSVQQLLDDLEADGIRSKERTSAKGKVTGGQPFSRGAMFHLLQNRVYVGDIVHKGRSHPGQHDGIVDQSTFDRVQAKLCRQLSTRGVRRRASFPLSGKLFDTEGNRLASSNSIGRSGRSYRYYVPAGNGQGGSSGPAKRFPASRVDALIATALDRIGKANQLNEVLVRAELAISAIDLVLSARLASTIRPQLEPGECLTSDEKTSVRWTIPALLQPRGGKAKVYSVSRSAPRRDETLIRALRAAHAMLQTDRSGLPIIEAIPRSRYEARLMRLAFLSPRIQRDILAGRQPAMFRLEDFARNGLPISWNAQEHFLRKRLQR